MAYDDLEERIKKRAYEIYIRRTQSDIWDYGKKGTELGDYYQAEKEIKRERQIT